MEQRRPAQAGAIAGSELHLVGDEVGEHANPFRVTAGLAVVDTERRDELQHPLHVRDLAAGHPFVARFLELALQITWLPNATSHGEPLGRAVGEEHRQIEERSQREQTATRAFQRDDGH